MTQLSRIRRMQALYGVLLIFGLAAIGTGAARMASGHWFSGLAAALAGIAALIAAWHVIRESMKMNVDTAQEPLHHPDISIKIDEDHFTAEQAQIFAQSILYPSSTFSRVRDKIELFTRAQGLDTAYTARLPAADAPFFVPLITLKKGILLDDLSIRTGGGEEISSLSYNDYLFVVRESLRKLVSATGKGALEKYLGIEKELLIKIGDRSHDAGSARDSGNKLIGTLEAIVGDSEAGKVAAALAGLLLDHYAVVVQVWTKVDSGFEWITIHTSQRVVMPVTDARRISDRIVNFARKLFGVRSSIFAVPLQRSMRAASYHLEFMGPEGTYLNRQIPVEESEGEYYRRFRNRLGQRYAHVYVRNGDAGLSKAWVWLSFSERPPGSVGQASIAAASAATLIFIAGSVWMQTAGGIDKSPNGGGDIVAVLLAFPAVVAAWTGFDRGSGPLSGTLASRFSSIITTILCLFCAGLFYLASKPVDGISIGGLDAVWSWAFLAALINTIAITFGWLRRASLYSWFISRATSPSLLAVGPAPERIQTNHEPAGKAPQN